MRVIDLLKLYYGRFRVEAEIYAIITLFHEDHCLLLVRNFSIDYQKAYTTKENYFPEVIAFDIISDKLLLFIRGCE